MRRILWAGLVLSVAVACQTTAPPVVTQPISNGPAPTTLPASREIRPIPNGPILLREGINLRKVVELGAGNIRLARNPANEQLYLLNPGTGLSRLELETGTVKLVVALNKFGVTGTPTGLAFGPDGAVYVTFNQLVDKVYNRAVIRKGTPASEENWKWSTLAETEPYALSGTNFDHQFNGLTVSADGEWVFVNSGSRTDHGEIQANKAAFKDVREVALTSKIFRLPSTAEDLVLPDDEAKLNALGVLFASGTRNAYDLEIAPNGELFAGDNGPDADYADELNWLREGQHYGFPWKFGNDDNPQQFPDYASLYDKRLQPDFVAVQTGAYRRDPTFPPAPAVEFALPVANVGPAATQYRAVDGSAQISERLYSFTPHRSPLGLVFVNTSAMPTQWQAASAEQLSAFILSWGAAGGTLSDTGQDLLHLQLTRVGDNYEMTAHQIAREFKNPIDAVLIENRLYVLEFGGGGAVWELTFEP